MAQSYTFTCAKISFSNPRSLPATMKEQPNLIHTVSWNLSMTLRPGRQLLFQLHDGDQELVSRTFDSLTVVNNNTNPKLTHDGKIKMLFKYTWPVNRSDGDIELQERIHILLSPSTSFEHIIELTRPFFLHQLGSTKRPTETQGSNPKKKQVQPLLNSNTKTLQKPLEPTPNLQQPIRPTPAPSIIQSQSGDQDQLVQTGDTTGWDESTGKISGDTPANEPSEGGEGYEDLKAKLLRGFTTDGSPITGNDRSSDTARPVAHTPRISTQAPSEHRTPLTTSTQPPRTYKTEISSSHVALSEVSQEEQPQMASLIQLSPKVGNSTLRASDLIGLDMRDETGDEVGLLDRFPPLTQAGVWGGKRRSEEMDVDEFDVLCQNALNARYQQAQIISEPYTPQHPEIAHVHQYRPTSTLYQGSSAYPPYTPLLSRTTSYQNGPSYQPNLPRPNHQAVPRYAEPPVDMIPVPARSSMLPRGQGVYDLTTDEVERLIDEVMVERGFEDFCAQIAGIITSREAHQDIQHQAQLTREYPINDQYQPRQSIDHQQAYQLPLSQESVMEVEGDRVSYHHDPRMRTGGYLRGNGEEDEYRYEGRSRGVAEYPRERSEEMDGEFEKELEGSME